MTKDEAMKLALVALMRSRKAVSGDLDLAGCAYGKNDPDGHRYADAKTTLVTLDKAITALREALAEKPAQQEPVAYAEQSILDWLADSARGPTAYAKTTLAKRKDGKAQIPLYTSPPAQQEPDNSNDLTIAYMAGVQRGKELAQRTWVGLTDVEWMNIVNKDQAWFGQRPDEVAHEVAKLVEAKLKELNT